MVKRFVLIYYIISCSCFFSCNIDKHVDTPLDTSKLDPSSSDFSNSAVFFKTVPVNDFNHGSDQKPNLWGWTDDYTYEINDGHVEIFFSDSITTVDNSGYALKLVYDVSPNNSSTSAWAQRLANEDGSEKGFFNAKTMGLNWLSFYIRGEKGGEEFKIGIRDSLRGTDPRIHINNIILGDSVTTSWQEASVLLEDLKEARNYTIDTSKLTLIGFYFESGVGPQTGTIYIDNITFRW